MAQCNLVFAYIWQLGASLPGSRVAPFVIVVAIFLIAGHVLLTGLLYGFDTSSIGVITQMTQFTNSMGRLTSTQQGIYVASILLSSSVSSLASGHISDRISRKYGILPGGIISLIGTIISAASPNFASLIVARLVTGVGIGQAISVTTVYLIEMAPVGIRGVAACFLQTYVVLGIMVGYFIAFGAHNITGSWAWRVPFVVQAVVAAVLCVGMGVVPFSPRWLVQVGRADDARRALSKVRPLTDVERELEEIQQSLDPEKQQQTASIREIFNRKYRGETALEIFLMAFQQLTGIDVVLYYAPILFRQAGFTSQRASFLSSGVTGIVMLVCTIPAQIWVDQWGRRKPLIYGGALMAVVCFLIIGSLYARYGHTTSDEVRLDSDSAQWVVIVLIYIFVANFSWSWAVVGKIYASEIIPTRLRAKVCAVELVANWVVNFIVTFTAPLFLQSSSSGPYFLYGFSTVVAVVVCVLMPETKGHSLEYIERLFENKGSHEESRPSILSGSA